MKRWVLTLACLLAPLFSLEAAILVGRGTADLTPPIGTPGAGYEKRQGKGMKGIHDPLLATALYLDTGDRPLVFCGVDHLGMDFSMVQEIKQRVFERNGGKSWQIFVASSHTHSGGGAFLNIPYVGEILAGKFDPATRSFYIEQVAQAILQASQAPEPAKMGHGSAHLQGLSHYRADWPKEFVPADRLHIWKFTSMDDQPLGVLFNFALHPTALGPDHLLFSADFVGVARRDLQELFAPDFLPVFINGAQGELIPDKEGARDEWDLCERVGRELAHAVASLWESLAVEDVASVETRTLPYSFEVHPNSAGILLPIKEYFSEVNVITVNEFDAIITVPGELSCFYENFLRSYAQSIGYRDIAIFGLTNDAHGYLLHPEAWDRQTYESLFSFGGREYGQRFVGMVQHLLSEKSSSPKRFPREGGGAAFWVEWLEKEGIEKNRSFGHPIFSGM